MKKVIWKYKLPTVYKFTIDIPIGGEILNLQVDEKTNIPCIWVLVNPDNAMEERAFELFVTGDDIHYDMGVNRKYVGTYQYDGGKFIGHVFERID